MSLLTHFEDYIMTGTGSYKGRENQYILVSQDSALLVCS